MRWVAFLFLIGFIGAQCVHAQGVAEPTEMDDAAADVREAAEASEATDASEAPDFRDTRGYAFPALSRTVRDMQNLAYAFQLRDYCADDRVPDAFVRIQLARFSLITGRDETCRTLVDY